MKFPRGFIRSRLPRGSRLGRLAMVAKPSGTTRASVPRNNPRQFAVFRVSSFLLRDTWQAQSELAQHGKVQCDMSRATPSRCRFTERLAARRPFSGYRVGLSFPFPDAEDGRAAAGLGAVTI